MKQVLLSNSSLFIMILLFSCSKQIVTRSKTEVRLDCKVHSPFYLLSYSNCAEVHTELLCSSWTVNENGCRIILWLSKDNLSFVKPNTWTRMSHCSAGKNTSWSANTAQVTHCKYKLTKYNELAWKFPNYPCLSSYQNLSLAIHILF